MLIYNANILTMDGNDIENGYVAVEGRTIAAVGPMSDCPAPSEGDTDAKGALLLPGFIDAHCHLGLLGDGLTYDQDDCNEESDPITPHMRAIDALYPLDNCFREAYEGGVTTVLTGPGSANAIGGQFAAVKTAGRWIDDMIVKAPVAMKFALGENPKGVYGDKKESPMTRMATAALIREKLSETREYLRKKRDAEKDEDADAPDFDARLEALVPVLERTLPAHFHAHRADDIATAIRISREFNLDFVIVHGTEGHLVADILAREGVRVITGPTIGDRSKPELAHQSVKNTARLAAEGIQVAICTDHPENPVQYLTLGAAICAKNGLGRECALRAITCDAAAIAGIADRVGSITVGKDADLVLWSGHPFELDSHPVRVWVDGKCVAE